MTVDGSCARNVPRTLLEGTSLCSETCPLLTQRIVRWYAAQQPEIRSVGFDSAAPVHRTDVVLLTHQSQILETNAAVPGGLFYLR